MRKFEKSNDTKLSPTPIAAGQFGILHGVELRPYRPVGCPSLEQFEASFLLANDSSDSPRAA